MAAVVAETTATAEEKAVVEAGGSGKSGSKGGGRGQGNAVKMRAGGLPPLATHRAAAVRTVIQDRRRGRYVERLPQASEARQLKHANI